jgi:hypothetical protein
MFYLFQPVSATQGSGMVRTTTQRGVRSVLLPFDTGGGRADVHTQTLLTTVEFCSAISKFKVSPFWGFSHRHALTWITNPIAGKELNRNQLDCQGLKRPTVFKRETHLDPFGPVSSDVGYKRGYNVRRKPGGQRRPRSWCGQRGQRFCCIGILTPIDLHATATEHH